MNQQPKLKIRLSAVDLFIGFMGWFTISALWIITVYYYPHLPHRIPTHFNIHGEAYKNGTKLTLFMLPIITTLVFAGMSVLIRAPHLFNYPIAITDNNAERQYKNATRLMRWLKFSIALTFLMITFQSIQLALHKTAISDSILLPAILSMVFIPVAIYLISAFRNK